MQRTLGKCIRPTPRSRTELWGQLDLGLTPTSACSSATPWSLGLHLPALFLSQFYPMTHHDTLLLTPGASTQGLCSPLPWHVPSGSPAPADSYCHPFTHTVPALPLPHPFPCLSKYPPWTG